MVQVNMQNDIEKDNCPNGKNVENSSKKETDKETLLTFIQQVNDRLKDRAKVRELNTKVTKQCQDEAKFTSLDSSVKKNTAFVRKLKHFTASQLPSILADFSSLNLTKYISEVATAIVEAKLKISDVDSAVQLCNALHRSYADFSGHLFKNWQKALMIKRDAKGVNASKLRVDLRFFAECVAGGMFSEKDGSPTLVTVLTRLVNADKEQHNFASVIVNFCRHCGHDFAGLVPTAIRRTSRELGMPVPRSRLVTDERQKGVRNLMMDYYRTLCKHLLHTHKKVIDFKQHNKKILQMRENIGAERRATGEELLAALQRLSASAASLAELLDAEPPPRLELLDGSSEGAEDERLRVVGGLGGGSGPEAEMAEMDPWWEDEETRMFYEEMPDVVGRGAAAGQELPPEELTEPCRDPDDLNEPEEPREGNDLDDILEEEEEGDEEEGDTWPLQAGTSPQNKDLPQEKEAPLEKAHNIAMSPQNEDLSLKEASPLPTEGSPKKSKALPRKEVLSPRKEILSPRKEMSSPQKEVSSPQKEMSSPRKEVSSPQKETLSPRNGASPQNGEPGRRGENRKAQRSAFLTDLVKCVNRDMIDRASIEFIEHFNTKANRKRLANTLACVTWRRLDLLPFYARLVATVHPLIPDVAVDVAAILRQDFKYHVRKKDQLKLSSKIKTVRFIGELVKFGMYSRIEALYCVKVLLHDLTHHNIDMCCNLMETCGRYLYRHEGSHERTHAYLEQMMRKKSVTPLDSRYATMIENVYYHIRPPDPPSHQPPAVPLPPQHAFLRHVVWRELRAETVDMAAAVLAGLDWDDPPTQAFAVRTLAEAHQVKFPTIRHLASLLNTTVTTRPEVGVLVVDAVLEDLRLGLEENGTTAFAQRRVATVHYLGELYNYCLVDNAVIFNALYLLVSLGAGTAMDPPEDLFRVRLVTVLLNASGRFFNAGASARKLDCFLAFYQRYYWSKRSDPYWTANKFPVMLDALFKETILKLRPGTLFCASYEESCAVVKALHRALIDETPEAYGVGRDSTDERDVEALLETDEKDSGEVTAAICDDAAAPDIGVVHLDCDEDEAFRLEFERMVSDDVHDRINEPAKQLDISVPLLHARNARGVGKATKHAAAAGADSTACVNFVLMTRKGNKPQFRNVLVPPDSELAVNLRQTEAAERIERERLKRLTLDISERLEEEEYQEMVAAAQRGEAGERQQHRKFQHQKGAPDANLIFGLWLPHGGGQ